MKPGVWIYWTQTTSDQKVIIFLGWFPVVIYLLLKTVEHLGWKKCTCIHELFETFWTFSQRQPNLIKSVDARNVVSKSLNSFQKWNISKDIVVFLAKEEFLLKVSIALLQIHLKTLFLRKSKRWIDDKKLLLQKKLKKQYILQLNQHQSTEVGFKEKNRCTTVFFKREDDTQALIERFS